MFKDQKSTGEGVWQDSKNCPTKSLKFPKKQKDLKEDSYVTVANHVLDSVETQCTYVVSCSFDNMANSFSH